MQKRWIVYGLMILSAALPVVHADELLRQVEHGQLYQHGSQKLLLLWGSPYEMGYAHGQLLKEDIRATVGKVLKFCMLADVAKKGNPMAGSLAKAYRRLAPHIPARYQQELQGLADGSGVELRKLQLANVFPALFHCSGFALFAQATEGGKLYHGRVLDYMTHLGLQKHAVTILARQ